jgi:DNA-directed RNA polymerase subunit RPC12/RpoP
MANTQQRVPGLKCPKCGNFIETSIEELISASYLECPHCRLRLTINKQESKKALDILSNVDKAKKNLERASHFNR